jgi:hypothetical protein
VHRVAAVIVLAVLAAHAFADSSTADRAAAEAQTRAANNDFVGAAAKYREAFKAEPRPELMCNVGVAYYKAKDLPRAHRYLDQCLSIGTSLDRAFIDNVKKVLAAVDSTLAGGSFTPVDLLVQPPTATTIVEGGAVFDEPIVGSRRIWFPFGKYRLTVQAAGHVDRVIEIDAKDRGAIPARVTLQVAPPVEAGSGSAQGSAQVPDAGSGSGVIEAPLPPPPPVARRSLIAPIIATTATVIAGGAALGFYLSAIDDANQAGKATERMEYDRLAESARDNQRISWVFGGIAGAGAIVSGVLWYRYSRSEPRVEVQATGDGAGVTLSGRW